MAHFATANRKQGRAVIGMGPNFLIAGAPKCGSTSLYHLLSQHPDVYFPACKEPGYYVRDYFRSISHASPNYQRLISNLVLNTKDYYRLYSDSPHPYKGDASITYLYQAQEATQKIWAELGNDIHIIFILRDPIKRLVSQYQYCVELGFEDKPLSQALRLEPERLANHWSSIYAYMGQGLYADGVQLFKNTFTNVTVVFSEDFRTDPQETLRFLCSRMGLSSFGFNTDNRAYNASGRPRSRIVHNLLLNKNPIRSIFYKLLRPLISRERVIQIQNKLRKANQTGFDSSSHYEIARAWAYDIYQNDARQLASNMNMDVPWFDEKSS